MAPRGALETIKSGSVVIPVYRLGNGNYQAKYVEHGRRRAITSKDLTVLRKKVRAKARALNKLRDGLPALEDLTDTQREVIREVLRHDLHREHAAVVREVLSRGLTLEDVVTLEGPSEPMRVKQAVAEFLESREEGHSGRYLRTLRYHLRRFEKRFGTRWLHAIKPREIDHWLTGQAENIRTRNNLRASLVTLFRWGQSKGVLKDGARTAAERTDRPKAKGRNKPGPPELFTPDELSSMLKACPEDYLPWLTIAAFAGLRTAELVSEQRGEHRKEVLQWEDVHLDHEEPHLVVRAEVSKNERRRIVPLQPVLGKWLTPLHKESGPVCPRRAPWAKKYTDHEAVIDKLEKVLPAGWKKNALRHSFGTYRTAVTADMPRVSLEMGNSVEMINRHYHDARTAKEGKAWFALTPAKVKRRLLKVRHAS